MLKGGWSIYIALAVIVLGLGFGGIKSLEALGAYRIEHSREREDVLRIDNEDTRAEVAERCGSSAPSRDCVYAVEDGKQAEKHELADLKAQQDAAEWSFASFLVNLAGLTFSGGGLWALVWTFREQRKLTQNESCAYLEILHGRVSEHVELGFQYDLAIVNNGATPAVKIVLAATMTVVGTGSNDSLAPRTFQLTARVSELSAKGEWTLIARIMNENVGLKAFSPEGTGSGARRYGSQIGTGNPEEDGPETKLSIDGKLVYFDVFGRSHELPIHQFMFLDFGGYLRGTGRNATRFPTDS